MGVISVPLTLTGD